MIKYQEQLENRKDYYMPLIDFFENGKKQCNCQLPISFFVKHENLLTKSKAYIEVFKQIDMEKYYKENVFQNDEKYDKYYDILSEYYSINEGLDYTVESYKKIEIDINEVKYYIYTLGRILNLLKDIYPNNKDIYNSKLIECKSAYEDIKKYSTIEYDMKSIKHKKVYLPDAWFILPDGTLYNTGNSHKGTSLIYDLDNVENAIKKSNSLKGTSKYYIQAAKRIKNEGFNEWDFKQYINLIYYPYYSDKTHEKPTCHEPNTLNYINGVVRAKIYFYNFFENFQKYISNESEFDNLMDLTKSDIADIFVRCCGFYKIESMAKRTITTSDLNYKNSLNKYIEKGWKVDFIPPIIIQREEGKISKLDMKNAFVKKYIENMER